MKYKGFIVDAGSKTELTDGDIGAFIAAGALLVIGAFGYAAYLYLTINMGVTI